MTGAEPAIDLASDLPDSFLRDALEGAHKTLETHGATAIAVLGDPLVRHRNSAYWSDADQPAMFEHRIAQAARQHGQTYGAFIVPAVGLDHEDLGFRPPGGPVRPDRGEYEVLLILAFDAAGGLDLCRQAFTRRPDGVGVFGPVEAQLGEAAISDVTPGQLLMRSLASQ